MVLPEIAGFLLGTSAIPTPASLVYGAISNVMSRKGMTWSALARDLGMTRSTLQRGFAKGFATSRQGTLNKLEAAIRTGQFNRTQVDTNGTTRINVALADAQTWDRYEPPVIRGRTATAMLVIVETPVSDQYKNGLKTELTATVRPGETALDTLRTNGFDPSEVHDVIYVSPWKIR